MNIDPFGDPFKAGLGLSTSDIFTPRRRGGGGQRPVSTPAEVESEPETGPADAAPEEDPEKPEDKVVLKNPKWEVGEVGFKEETDISVEGQ